MKSKFQINDRIILVKGCDCLNEKCLIKINYNNKVIGKIEKINNFNSSFEYEVLFGNEKFYYLNENYIKLIHRDNNKVCKNK